MESSQKKQDVRLKFLGSQSSLATDSHGHFIGEVSAKAARKGLPRFDVQLKTRVRRAIRGPSRIQEMYEEAK